MGAFIKTRGKDCRTIGYRIPKLYYISFTWIVLKNFGLAYVKDRIRGWHVWYAANEDDYNRATFLLELLSRSYSFVAAIEEFRA